MAQDHHLLVFDAVRALQTSQRQLAKLVGVSRSTTQRLYARRTKLTREQLTILARAVFPKDRAVAARAAELAGTTLQALGLVAAAAPAAPPPPPAPKAAAAPPPSPHVADSVLCAAAEVMNVPPQQVRAVLHAAFARARDLGLTPEMVAKAFERVEGA